MESEQRVWWNVGKVMLLRRKLEGCRKGGGMGRTGTARLRAGAVQCSATVFSSKTNIEGLVWPLLPKQTQVESVLGIQLIRARRGASDSKLFAWYEKLTYTSVDI